MAGKALQGSAGESSLEKIYRLAKLAAKMQYIIYIIFAIVLLVTSVLSFFGVQADGCILRYPVKRQSTSSDTKIPGSSTKFVRANGDYSKNNKNYPGDQNCPDCFSWVDSGIYINESMADKGEIYLSVKGKASMCASYLLENNIHMYGNQYLDKNGEPIRIPKFSEDSNGIMLNLLAKKDTWGNLVHIMPNDDLMISLVKSSFVDVYDPITGDESRVDCSSTENISNNLSSCGKYSYEVSTDGCKCSDMKTVEGCRSREHFPRKAFDDDAKRVVNYSKLDSNDKWFSVCMKYGGAYSSDPCAAMYPGMGGGVYTFGERHPFSDFFSEYHLYNRPEYDNMCFSTYKTKHYSYIDKKDHYYFDKEPSVRYQRKIWQDDVNTYKGTNSEIDYFDYSKKKEKDYVDTAFTKSSSSCFMKDLPCDYKPGDFNEKQINDFSRYMGFYWLYIPYFDPDAIIYYSTVKKLWFSDGTGIIFRIVDNASSIDTTQYDNSYGFLSKLMSNGEMKINYDKYYKKQDISDGKYLQLKLYKPNSVSQKLAVGGYLLNIKHSPCTTKNGNFILDRNKNKVGGMEYVFSNKRPSKNYTGASEANPSPNTSDDNGLYILNVGKSAVGQKLWIRVKSTKDKPNDIDGGYSVDFLQDSASVGSDDTSKTIAKTVVKAANKFYNMGMDQFKKITQSTDVILYIRFILIIYIMFLGAGFITGSISINNYDLFIRLFKVVIIGGLLDNSTFDFFENYLYPILLDFPQTILANTISNEYIDSGSGSGSSTILLVLGYFASVFSETFFSVSFFPKLMSVMASGFGGLLILAIVFSVGMMTIAVCKYIVVFMTSVIFNGLLIGLTPIFLTFALFEKTKYLFDNWLKYLVVYLVEPIIVGLGLIVFVNLFLIYLDSIFNYSVCFKCYIPIYIPIASLEIDIFCMSWFLPWGTELKDIDVLGTFVKSISDSFGLLIIASSANKYNSIAISISSKISNVCSSMTQFATNSNNIKNVMGDFDQKMKGVAIYRGAKGIAEAAAEGYKKSRGSKKGVLRSLFVDAPKAAGGKIASNAMEAVEGIKNLPKSIKNLPKSINKKANLFSGDFWKDKTKKTLDSLKSKDDCGE